MARPTWLGGSPPASALASAPTFNKGIAKPSETAKPYPTTNTPEGYALNTVTSPDAGRSAASTSPAVTYGSTPPPSATAKAASAVAPQVGPYAPLQQAPSAAPATDPAAAVTSGFAAAPAFGGTTQPPATPTPPSGDRYADASGSSPGWSGPPSSQPAAQSYPQAMPTAPTDARYGESPSSRFSTSFQPGQPTPPMQLEGQPQWTTPPVDQAAPPVTPPPAADGSLPGGMTPPTRRPDPGYRPGGTSSYRPTKTLLAGDDEPGSVQPVSFSSPQ